MQKKAFIDPADCDGSPFCPVKRVCPQKAVAAKGGGFGGVVEVDAEKCTGCGKCVEFCPHRAVAMV